MDCDHCIPPGPGKLPGRVHALRMPLQAMVKAKNSSFLFRPLGRHFQFLYPQILLQTPDFKLRIAGDEHDRKLLSTLSVWAGT